MISDTSTRRTVSLKRLADAGYLLSVDVHFAQFCLRHIRVIHEGTVAASADPTVLAPLFAEVSRALRTGHPCVSLQGYCGRAHYDDEDQYLGHAPLLAEVLPMLRDCACVTQVDSEWDGLLSTPLVLDDQRLYLARYFDHERRLSESVVRLLTCQEADVDRAWLEARLDHFFPPDSSPKQQPDLQRRAADRALSRRFAVISGGPGTGKTYTVVKILALLSELAQHNRQDLPRVLLLAPTGKAAARLVESVTSALRRLELDPKTAATIVQEASTIHRALGTNFSNSTRFLRGPAHPLLADVVLVDEASMVDLRLMRHLFGALRPDTRVILLGDRHQLASVEAGSVLAELCSVLTHGETLVELRKSFRFSAESGISALAHAVKEGDRERATAILHEGREDLIFISDFDAHASEHGGVLRAPDDGLQGLVVRYLGGALRQRDPASVLAQLDRFRLLCAHRRGPFGVQALNLMVRRILAMRGLVSEAGEFYRGRLVLVTRNDYSLGLSNGDIGLCWPDPAGRLVVHFPSSEGGMRILTPSQLPPHETAFALTIHKSQGSEYEQVGIVLPPADSPLLTRELLYTAVTRAKKRAILFGTEAAIRAACERSVVRSSGLSTRIRRSLSSASRHPRG